MRTILIEGGTGLALLLLGIYLTWPSVSEPSRFQNDESFPDTYLMFDVNEPATILTTHLLWSERGAQLSVEFDRPSSLVPLRIRVRSYSNSSSGPLNVRSTSDSLVLDSRTKGDGDHHLGSHEFILTGNSGEFLADWSNPLVHEGSGSFRAVLPGIDVSCTGPAIPVDEKWWTPMCYGSFQSRATARIALEEDEVVVESTGRATDYPKGPPGVRWLWTDLEVPGLATGRTLPPTQLLVHRTGRANDAARKNVAGGVLIGLAAGFLASLLVDALHRKFDLTPAGPDVDA